MPVPKLPPIQILLHELIEIGRDFHHRGWSLGTSSNYSVVIERNPLTLLMTGSGFDKGKLQSNQFVMVGEDGEGMDPDMPKPSAEAMLHVALAKHGAGVILHTHSIAATTLSEGFLPYGAIQLAGYEMLKGLSGITTHETTARIEVFPNTQDINSFSKVIEQRLADTTNPLRHGFLMAGHGLYTWGDTIADARRQVEVLEFLFEVVTQKRLLFGSF